MKLILLLISLFAAGHGLRKISIKPVDEPIDAQPAIEPANPPVDAVSSDQDLGAPPADAPPKPSDDLLPNGGAAPSNEQGVASRGDGNKLDTASLSRRRPGYPGFYYYPMYEYYWCWTHLGWRMCTRRIPRFYPHYPPFYPYGPYGPYRYPFRRSGAIGGFRQAQVAVQP